MATSETDDPYADGLVQNHVERYIATEGHPLNMFLLPLLSYPTQAHDWLVFPRVYPEETDSRLSSAFDELEELGFTEEELYAPEHWAGYDDQWRLIDCGYAPPNHTSLHLPDEAYPDFLRD